MKIKAIAQICKAEKTIIISDDGSRQWISNGAAIYPLFNLPKLTENHIYTMFDIAEDKRDKFYFEERELPDAYDFNDTVEGEQILERGKLSLYVEGRTLEPLKTTLGIVFINERFLTPFSDLTEGYELYERIDERGQVYIAVKSGFMLQGIIVPYDLISDEFISQLREMLTLAELAYDNKVETINKRNSERYKEEQEDEE